MSNNTPSEDQTAIIQSWARGGLTAEEFVPLVSALHMIATVPTSFPERNAEIAAGALRRSAEAAEVEADA